MAFIPRSKLPRLAREWYCGTSMVLWTHGIVGRATGWLDDRVHYGFREAVLHGCARYSVGCPAYVLMPDHAHILLVGTDDNADQILATRLLRRCLSDLIAPVRLQDRAHDHVLRSDERSSDRIGATTTYVLENPQRAGLVADWRSWPFLGAIVPGYPRLDPRQPAFRDRFWGIYARRVDGESLPPLTRRATGSATA